MLNHRIFNKSNTTGATSRVGSATPLQHMSLHQFLRQFTLFNRMSYV